ncbi:MAG: hypothetical protein GF383_10020 [Candidatus Lokiarchaeota archaeon]|nr:hypothetical protein [Candidatus Lokiarchaeota archaeon]MBD3340871.1 hypothetical protein [Candidatus Lokiarchaeota archaeon]
MAELLELADSNIFRELKIDVIISRLINIYFLGKEVLKIGINPNSLEKIRQACYNVCIIYLMAKNILQEEEPGLDNFHLIFKSLLFLNKIKDGKKPPSKQISLGDLSEMMSLGTDRTYLYGVLYRNSRISWRNLNNLFSYIPVNTFAYYEIDKYLTKYHWRRFRKRDKGYHKYWDRPEVKIVLKKYLVDETLGLDIYLLIFFNPDNDDLIDLHHISGNNSSNDIKDLVPLLVSSHRSLTFTDLNKTQIAVKISNKKILKRKLNLRYLTSLNYSKENEIIIKNLLSGKLWSEIGSNIKQEWIFRWKDKNISGIREWYKKYGFSGLLKEYEKTIERLKKICTSSSLKSKFIFWFFQSFVPNLS